MNNYNFREVEAKFQSLWDFKAEKNNKPKYYVLSMFPYPSGRLHVGHLRNYVIGDVLARFKRGMGFNVLHPIGWDAFGLPAENAAIEHGSHPRIWTDKNIETMKESLKRIGLSYNWEREIKTCNPDYYKHEQKFFLDFFKNGIAYKKKSQVNWDPVDNTVLANEQVVDGKGWRSGVLVEKKDLEQWFLKITDYASELLEDLKELKDWPEKVTTMQLNWIGKSEGATLNFKISGKDEYLKVFTTSPETIFGASFCAISCDHPIVEKLGIKVKDRFKSLSKEKGITEKEGFDTGFSVDHPFLPNKKLPIYVANFVLMEYGTGALFGCPAHDKQDFEFAQKYNLEILPVIEYSAVGERKMCNSAWLNGMNVCLAKESIVKKIEEENIGVMHVNYHLRDWGVSRQRYWGCPIPIIYCDSCGIQCVPEVDLPVKLPDDVDFSKPGNPLDNHPTWKYTKCPKCNKDAVRDTDTFDTFFESSWYFAAFCNPSAGIDRAYCDYFLPVDTYIGGIEHAVMHLLYSRFFAKILKKCGYLNSDKTFTRLITQGMVCHKTYKGENGEWLFPEDAQKAIEAGKKVQTGKLEKMSKSKKNIIDPDEIIKKYGADTARFFILSDNPPENDFEWSSAGVEAAFRYINKLVKLVDSFVLERDEICKLEANLNDRKKMHKILKDLNEHLEHVRLNCAVAKIHELANLCLSQKSIQKEGIPILVRVLEPFVPHLSEYLSEKIGNIGMMCNAPWVEYDYELIIEDNIKIAVQINGKFKKTMEVHKGEQQEKVLSSAMALLKITNYKKVIYVQEKAVNFIC